MSIELVWFKRDLRIIDHEPLYKAAKRGPVLALYIIEPGLWEQPDMSYRHYRFLGECIHDLQRSLTQIGLNLVLRKGEA